MKLFRRKTDKHPPDCNPNCSYRKGWRASTITMMIGAIGATLTGIAYLVLAVLIAPKLPPVTEADVPQLCGWAGQQVAKEEFSILAKHFIAFRIKGAPQDNARKRAVLWDAARIVNDGKHLPTYRQLIGDCVGAGAKQAMDYLQCVEMVRTGESEFKPIYEPYHYACGRNAPECGRGRMGRDPSGSIGSWQALALTLYGALPSDLSGLEPYSERVISKWAVRMPDRKWIDQGRKHLVKSAAQAKTPEEVRDGLCNGYPATTASNWGGQRNLNRALPVVDGKYVNKRQDTWPHQQCIIGYDGTGKEPYWFVLNSWGPDIYEMGRTPPPDDSPPGGYWVSRKDLQFMLADGDTFILSQFDGFESQEWIIITSREKPKTLPEASALVRRAVADRLNHISLVERN